MQQEAKTPWQPQRRKNHARRRRMRVLRVVIIGAVILSLAYVCITKWLQSENDSSYYFTSSQYDGVSSKFIVRETSSEKTSLEYPITDSKPINSFIEKEINDIDYDFRQTLQRSQKPEQPMSQTVSYQITHNSKSHLSIILHIKQDTIGAHPTNATRFWTLRKSDGAPVTIQQLTENSEKSIQKIIHLANQQINAILEKRGISPSHTGYTLQPDHVTQFLIRNDETLEFAFGAGIVIPSTYGEITITIRVEELSQYLQNDLARHLFKVPTPNPNPKNTSTIKTEKPINTASCSGKSCIALTFDDGPGAHTSRLLDILKQRNTKATFFVLGNKVARNTTLLQRMKSEGHNVANHSWSHANLSKLPAHEIRSEIIQTNNAIRDAIGESPTFIREPYGASSETVQSELRTLGMSSVLWSIDTRDWADRDSTIVCRRVTSNARSGAIILLHDIHTSSVDAVPCIIDDLTKQGYILVTIHELLGKTNPGQKYYSG